MLSFIKDRLAIHLLGRLLLWCGLVLSAVIFVTIFSQLLRVAPLFAGVVLSPGELAGLLGRVALPVAGFALTPAVLVAISVVATGMRADGEWVALEAAGITRGYVLRGFVAFVLLAAALSGWLWMLAGPSAVSGVRRELLTLADRALIGQVRPGSIASLGPGVTVFADSRDGRDFTGLFLDLSGDGGSGVRLVAPTGRLGAPNAEGVMEVTAKDGTLALRSGASRIQARFGELHLALPLDGDLRGPLEFFPATLGMSSAALLSTRTPAASYEFWRRVAGPLGVVALAALALALVFGGLLPGPAPSVAISLGCFAVYHLAMRGLEGPALLGALDPMFAALGPAAVFLAGVAAGRMFVVLRQRTSIVRKPRFM